MPNLTENLDHEAELLYEYLYGGTRGQLLLYSSTCLLSFVGPILMLGIVIFEMFGGDSQKRTIVNRLLSEILINTALWSILIGTTRIARNVFGLLEFDVAMFLRSLTMFLRISIYIFYNLLTISRFLFIVVWRRMRGVQDKFWMLFFIIATYSIAFWSVIYIYMFRGHPNTGLLLSLAKTSGQNGTSKYRYYLSNFVQRIINII